MHEVAFLPEHELRPFVGKFQEYADLIAQELEEVVSLFPPQNSNSEEKLKSQSPDHWSPFHLELDFSKRFANIPPKIT